MKKRKDPRGRVLKDGEVYRKTDDSYMYRWTSSDGKRHTIYAKTLEALREKEEQHQKDVSDGIRVEASKVTVNDVYALWKRDKIGLKERTFMNYIYMYERFVLDDFGKMKVQQVKRSDARRFYNKLVDTVGISIATLDSIHTVLCQVFKIAVEDMYIRTNPVSELLGEIKRAHNYQAPKRHALTIPQQEAFLNYVAETPKFMHWLPLFTFFLGTGCRVGEVVGLRWCDVNFDENYIDINHSVAYYQKDGRASTYSVSTPKTEAGNRIIPMLPEVKEAIYSEKAYQDEVGLTCQANIDGYTDFIFLNRFGATHNPSTINRTISRIVLAYNEQELEKSELEDREPLLLPQFSCHNLRHTFATRYCENETNLKVIQEILGHKDIATTMDVYAEATKDAKVKSFENLQGKIKIR